MAEGKLDLPDDLLSSKTSDHAWTSKVETSGGNGEDKIISYDSKEQAVLDNSIPLSPQWLCYKPGESKMEMRTPSSLSLGSSADSNLKDAWRSDGSDEKKDRRKSGTETDQFNQVYCLIVPPFSISRQWSLLIIFTVSFSLVALTSERHLQAYNGTLMPNVEQLIRINWATFVASEKRQEDTPDYIIFVGDLVADVTDYTWQETFMAHYPSVKGAKVVTDMLIGRTKGYGL